MTWMWLQLREHRKQSIRVHRIQWPYYIYDIAVCFFFVFLPFHCRISFNRTWYKHLNYWIICMCGTVQSIISFNTTQIIKLNYMILWEPVWFEFVTFLLLLLLFLSASNIRDEMKQQQQHTRIQLFFFSITLSRRVQWSNANACALTYSECVQIKNNRMYLNRLMSIVKSHGVMCSPSISSSSIQSWQQQQQQKTIVHGMRRWCCKQHSKLSSK